MNPAKTSGQLLAASFCVAVTLLAPRPGQAHVGIASGPAFANKSQKITFSVGHGCDGADTYRVRVDIPAGVTSVRALRSDFGKPTIIRDEVTPSVIVAVEWEKPLEDLQDEDVGFYELTLRARVPDAPFTQIPFTVTQTCRDSSDVETTEIWTGDTAAVLNVVPSRLSGWNSFTLGASTTIPEALVPIFFGDAQIVWRGTAAYSANPVIATVIAATPNVTVLTGDLAPGDQIWVKY